MCRGRRGRGSQRPVRVTERLDRKRRTDGDRRHRRDRQRVGGRSRRLEQRARDVLVLERRRRPRYVVDAHVDRGGEDGNESRPRLLRCTRHLADGRRRLGGLQRVHNAL